MLLIFTLLDSKNRSYYRVMYTMSSCVYNTGFILNSFLAIIFLFSYRHYLCRYRHADRQPDFQAEATSKAPK